MDQLTVATDREQEIQALIDEFGLDEAEARFAVALGHGEIDGDVRFVPPLTPEVRRRIGLDRGPYNDPIDQGRPA